MSPERYLGQLETGEQYFHCPVATGGRRAWRADSRAAYTDGDLSSNSW
jgi:hypothetical protein